MGIQSFYKNLIETFPNLNEALKTLLNTEDKKFLYFDFNGVLHPCASKVVQKYKDQDPKTINREKMEEEMFEVLRNQTLKIVEKINPYFIMIAVDGVAPMGKQNQQRARRYKSVIEKKETRRIFDTNSISPGTMWMKRITEKMKRFVDTELKKKCRVLFLDASIPGEGEGKIINFIKDYKMANKPKHIIYGLDSDLIVLSMTTGLDNLYLLREKQHFELKNENESDYKKEDDEMDKNLNILPISKLREYYWSSVEPKIKTIVNKQQYLMDICFLTFFLGNDFLPHLKTISTYNDGLNIIIGQYQKTLKVIGKSLLYNGRINMDVLKMIIKHYADKEEFYNIKNNKRNLDKIVRYYEDGWKQRYYNYYLGKENTPKQIEQICRDYFKTIVWNKNYYMDRKTNWNYYYKYNFAPTIKDLYIFLENNDINKFYFPQDQPCSQTQQLMCILPPHSSYLVPKYCANLMNGELKYFYPRRFNLDRVDKYARWKHMPILPVMNVKLIKQMVQ